MATQRLGDLFQRKQSVETIRAREYYFLISEIIVLCPRFRTSDDAARIKCLETWGQGFRLPSRAVAPLLAGLPFCRKKGPEERRLLRGATRGLADYPLQRFRVALNCAAAIADVVALREILLNTSLHSQRLLER